MSVEEARERILDHVTYDDAAANTAIDRLILEVQASMPCYPQCVIGQRVPHCYNDGVSDGGPPDPLCPSCTARMKLKETADA